MHTNPDHITAAEAAEILGVDRSHLSRLVRSGIAPVVFQMPGKTGARLFSRRAIRALAKKRQADRAEAVA